MMSICVFFAAMPGGARRITSIEKAWRIFIALGAGLGMPAMLRWLWWRANAWTEIAGMVVAAVTALVVYTVLPNTRDEYLLLVIVGAATVASVVATLVTPPVPRSHLAAFVARVQPAGWWASLPGAGTPRVLARLATLWLTGSGSVFALTFGIGHLLLSRPLLGLGEVAFGGVLLSATIVGLKQTTRVVHAG
jgi:hypothetical protein